MATRADPAPEAQAADDAAPVVVSLPPPQDPGGLARLLQFESEVRRQSSVNELVYFTANETRRILGYDQMFVLKPALVGGAFHVAGVSSLAVVDRNAPLIQAIEKSIAALGAQAGLSNPNTFAATAFSDDPALAEYPFQSFHWQPLKGRDGSAFAGLFIARGEPFREGELVRLERVAETVGHGWLALTGGKPTRRLPKLDSTRKRWLAIAALAAVLFPVRITALAPVEVVPARPFVVAAPYPGVIARIHVAPNERVAANQTVLTFEDIKVRNELRQAEERLQVARARVERSTSAAFGKKEEAAEIATARAEFEVAQAQVNYARDLMAKSQITAPVGGMAIYSDRRDWEGRAVNVGDPILQIADPRLVSYRIDLPAKEQMTLKPGGDVKVWLDSQPLWSMSGRIEQASYQARPTADGVLAFAVIAKPASGDIPRIGSRGTAKLYGTWVPFSYALLRRPIASARQFIGL